jgi:hypothetical protein
MPRRREVRPVSDLCFCACLAVTEWYPGVVGAKDGTKTITTGGSKAAFNRSLAFLEPMEKKVTHCGDLGAGLAVKIVNK